MVTMLRDNKNRGANGVHERRAQMRQQSADEKAFSIETVLSTEQPVRMWDWDRWEPIDEILLASGRSVAESVPLLDSHRTETINRVLGHVENVRTENTDTVGLMLFDASDPDAVKAFNKYRGNHATDVSVGYVVTGWTEAKPGETVTVEGRSFTAGARRLRVATSWRLNELSCVARGADSKAKVRGDDQPTARMSQLTDAEIEQLQTMQRSAGTLLESRIESTETPSVVINITNGQIEKPAERSAGNTSTAGNGNNERTSVMTTTTKPETTGTVDESEILKRGVQIERKRQADIKAIADGVRAETLTKAMDDADCTVDKARELFLKDLQEQRTAPPARSDAPGMIVGNRERDCNENSLALALAARMGVRNLESVGGRIMFDSFTGQVKFRRADEISKGNKDEFLRNLERSDKFRGIHSVDLCREALRMSKMEEPVDRHDLVTRAVSSPAISSIYTNAAASVLIIELEQYEDSTLGWTNEIDVPNFMETGLHRIEGGRLKKRNKGRKADHSTIAATMESVKVGHFADTLILDVIDIVNDSIGALRAGMDAYALGISDLRPSLVYGMLAANAALKTDGVALFHADHNNLATSTALTAANLQTVLNKMAGQKDAGGTVLNLTSCYIVTGGYSFVADQLANSAEIRESAAANGTKNPFLRHGLGVAPDARLNVGFTDPDTNTAVAAAPTLWYLASKRGRHGATVAFIDGLGRMPKMSTKVLNSEGQYGLSIDISHAIGAGISGFQGLQKATG
jgi:hypothetical protein